MDDVAILTAENARLRERDEHWSIGFDALKANLARLEAVINRVRAIHADDDLEPGRGCQECMQRWPCDTARALSDLEVD
jgi:hypothetical protein